MPSDAPPSEEFLSWLASCGLQLVRVLDESRGSYHAQVVRGGVVSPVPASAACTSVSLLAPTPAACTSVSLYASTPAVVRAKSPPPPPTTGVEPGPSRKARKPVSKSGNSKASSPATAALQHLKSPKLQRGIGEVSAPAPMAPQEQNDHAFAAPHSQSEHPSVDEEEVTAQAQQRALEQRRLLGVAAVAPGRLHAASIYVAKAAALRAAMEADRVKQAAEWEQLDMRVGMAIVRVAERPPLHRHPTEASTPFSIPTPSLCHPPCHSPCHPHPNLVGRSRAG